eukprot:Gb_26039 [translate_table: standard]
MENAYARSVTEVFEAFGVDPAQGLTDLQVAEHAKIYGRNELGLNPPIWHRPKIGQVKIMLLHGFLQQTKVKHRRVVPSKSSALKACFSGNEGFFPSSSRISLSSMSGINGGLFIMPLLEIPFQSDPGPFAALICPLQTLGVQGGFQASPEILVNNSLLPEL